MPDRKKSNDSPGPRFADSLEERFARLCRERPLPARESAGGADAGIHLYGEKTMHVLLKDVYCPDRTHQEVRLTPEHLRGTYRSLTDADTRRAPDYPVADILTPGGEIMEVQTGSLYPLARKIHFYLCATGYRVTVIHPVIVCKWLRWIDPQSGEVTAWRRSPRRGGLRDAAAEIYWMAPYLAEPRFSLRIPLLEAEETRLRDGWSRDGKKGSHRSELVPRGLLEEKVFSCPEDYAEAFLPDEERLPSPFTAAQYARVSGIRGRATYGMLRILSDLDFLLPGEAAKGRARTWERRGTQERR